MEARDIQELKALGHGQRCTICWSEGGGGEVHRIWDMLFFFEIPQYGGEGRFIAAFPINEVEKLMDQAKKLT